MRTAEELPITGGERVARVVELLGVMLSRTKDERPFLIVTDLESDRFVQFAGSRTEELLLDVPALLYQRRFPGVRSGSDLETVTVLGFALLARQLPQLTAARPIRWLVDLQWVDLREVS